MIEVRILLVGFTTKDPQLWLLSPDSGPLGGFAMWCSLWYADAGHFTNQCLAKLESYAWKNPIYKIRLFLRLESLVIWYNFDFLWSFSIFELLRWQRLFCFLQMQVVETSVDKKGPPDTSLHPSIFMSSPSPGSDTHLQRLQLPELAELAQERHEFIHLKGWICATRLILEAS